MTKIEFKISETNQLEFERYNHPSPIVQKRMEVLYLKSQGISHKKICNICHISKTTLVKYLKQFITGGVEGLKKVGYKGKPNRLMEYKESLESYFRNHPPRTTAEAQSAIEKITGIKRSPTQVRAFMKRIGLKVRKVGFVPGKSAEPAKQIEQEEFREKELEPRLNEAKEGKRVVLFMDAAHFVHGAFLGMVWCFVRIFIPSPSGRRRFNVLGVVNAITKQIITITNETYINSETVCTLMAKIAQEYAGQVITIVLDNARYQRCALVEGFAACLGIELLFLPSYSPQLNLIERLWRFVRKKCLYSYYYPEFRQFKEAIHNCLSTANIDHKEELESLLTLNFQSFKKVKVSTV